MLVLAGHTSAVYALAFSPDGRFLASGTRDGAVWLWESSGRRELVPADLNPPRTINSIDFHPTTAAVVVGDSRGWLELRLSDGDPVRGHSQDGSVTAARYLSPELIAVGRGDRAKQEPGAFELWDVASRARREPHFPASLGVRAVAVVPGHKRVAWTESGRKLAVWDITRPDAAHLGLNHNAIALAFSPDGGTLAAALGWEVHVLDADKRYWRAVLKGHKGVVPSVAFSPDGRLLASGSWDGTVRFWDPHSGVERAAFQWPLGRVYSLAFSPDGLRVAAAGDAGSIVIWDTV